MMLNNILTTLISNTMLATKLKWEDAESMELLMHQVINGTKLEKMEREIQLTTMTRLKILMLASKVAILIQNVLLSISGQSEKHAGSNYQITSREIIKNLIRKLLAISKILNSMKF